MLPVEERLSSESKAIIAWIDRIFRGVTGLNVPGSAEYAAFWKTARRKFILAPRFGFASLDLLPRDLSKNIITAAITPEMHEAGKSVQINLIEGLVVPFVQNNRAGGFFIDGQGEIKNFMGNDSEEAHVRTYVTHVMTRAVFVDPALNAAWEKILAIWKEKFGIQAPEFREDIGGYEDARNAWGYLAGTIQNIVSQLSESGQTSLRFRTIGQTAEDFNSSSGNETIIDDISAGTILSLGLMNYLRNRLNNKFARFLQNPSFHPDSTFHIFFEDFTTPTVRLIIIPPGQKLDLGQKGDQAMLGENRILQRLKFSATHEMSAEEYQRAFIKTNNWREFNWKRKAWQSKQIGALVALDDGMPVAAYEYRVRKVKQEDGKQAKDAIGYGIYVQKKGLYRRQGVGVALALELYDYLKKQGFRKFVYSHPHKGTVLRTPEAQSLAWKLIRILGDEVVNYSLYKGKNEIKTLVIDLEKFDPRKVRRYMKSAGENPPGNPGSGIIEKQTASKEGNVPARMVQPIAGLDNKIAVNPETGRLSFAGDEPVVKLDFDFYAERHGVTDGNQKEVFQGNADEAINQLNEEGRRQVKEGAEKLFVMLEEKLRNGENFIFLTSELTRAQDTAQAFVDLVKERLGLAIEVKIDPGANEINFGTWSNRSPESFPKETDNMLRYRGEDATVAAPKGESFIDVLRRQKAWMEELNRKYAGKTVVLFGHGVTISAIRVLLGDKQMADETAQIGWRKEKMLPTAQPVLLSTMDKAMLGKIRYDPAVITRLTDKVAALRNVFDAQDASAFDAEMKGSFVDAFELAVLKEDILLPDFINEIFSLAQQDPQYRDNTRILFLKAGAEPLGEMAKVMAKVMGNGLEDKIHNVWATMGNYEAMKKDPEQAVLFVKYLYDQGVLDETTTRLFVVDTDSRIPFWTGTEKIFYRTLLNPKVIAKANKRFGLKLKPWNSNQGLNLEIIYQMLPDIGNRTAEFSHVLENQDHFDPADYLKRMIVKGLSVEKDLLGKAVRGLRRRKQRETIINSYGEIDTMTKIASIGRRFILGKDGIVRPDIKNPRYPTSDETYPLTPEIFIRHYLQYAGLIMGTLTALEGLGYDVAQTEAQYLNMLEENLRKAKLDWEAKTEGDQAMLGKEGGEIAAGPSSTDKALGQRIKEVRLKQGFSVIDLAEKLGVSRQAISFWESGKSVPAPGNLIQLAAVLKTDVSVLYTGKPLAEALQEGSLGQRIKILRMVRGLTQNDLAQKIGVSGPSLISLWEQGKRKPSAHHLEELERVLGIAVSLNYTSEPLDEAAIEALKKASLGQRIKILRKARRFTLRALARAVGLPMYRIFNFEHGREIPKGKDLEALMRALNVSRDILTGFSVAPEKAIPDKRETSPDKAMLSRVEAAFEKLTATDGGKVVFGKALEKAMAKVGFSRPKAEYFSIADVWAEFLHENFSRVQEGNGLILDNNSWNEGRLRDEIVAKLSAIIEDKFTFSDKLMKKIIARAKALKGKVIARSSGRLEDNFENSLAGVFTSIKAENPKLAAVAIAEVFKDAVNKIWIERNIRQNMVDAVPNILSVEEGFGIELDEFIDFEASGTLFSDVHGHVSIEAVFGDAAFAVKDAGANTARYVLRRDGSVFHNGDEVRFSPSFDKLPHALRYKDKTLELRDGRQKEIEKFLEEKNYPQIKGQTAPISVEQAKELKRIAVELEIELGRQILLAAGETATVSLRANPAYRESEAIPDNLQEGEMASPKQQVRSDINNNERIPLDIEWGIKDG
ncbi:MAG: helix-turn-helix domain-containing protein, partial [Candidatus Omnitrophica bacterium]|nr:helix-turn-helix domain-containing protein [Candidatus Omnitrophota bacterium]